MLRQTLPLLACLASALLLALPATAQWTGQATSNPQSDADDAELAEELASATAAEEPEPDDIAAPQPVFYCNSDDPYVMLDEAKLSIGEGKLRRASAMLAVIDASSAEPFVQEELLLQRLLLAAAFLNAAGSVLKDAQAAGYADSKYAAWLKEEGGRYAAEYCTLADRYLTAVADGLDCDFARFRLPRVTADHLSDAVLYSDPQVLRAAVQNWDQDKTGLGKGLIGTQARVALVLGAATFYDMPQGARTLEAVSARLLTGVPLDERIVYDWLAQTAFDQRAVGGPSLATIQQAVDGRLLTMLQTPGSLLRQRYDMRNGAADAAAVDKAAKPAANRTLNRKR